MKLRFLAATALVLMTTSLAQAAFNADDLVAQFSADGFSRIEIKIGQRTAKLEAFKGTTKIEITYDLASGEIIKSETETVPDGTVVTPGVEIRTHDDHGGHGDDDGPDDNGHHTGTDDSGHHGDDDDSGHDGGDDDSGHHGGGDDSGHHGGDDD